MSDTPIFISTEQLAARLKCTTRTILRMVRRLEIPEHCYTQAGTRGPRRFLLGAVDYLAAHGCWPTTRAVQAKWVRDTMVSSPAKSLVGLRLSELQEVLGEVTELGVLHTALSMELAGTDRSGAVDALRSRIAELQEGAVHAA